MSYLSLSTRWWFLNWRRVVNQILPYSIAYDRVELPLQMSAPSAHHLQTKIRLSKPCCQLRRRVLATEAMKESLVREPLAAQMYATVMKNRVNLYPCVISPFVPWLAASPDRKVYWPERSPSFGLLEKKCPQADQLANVTCLSNNGRNLKLKLSHDYYYQVQCQMAVTGLQWCDFVVYLGSGALHVETITFDSDFWHEVEEKLQSFYFNYFINDDDL